MLRERDLGGALEEYEESVELTEQITALEKTLQTKLSKEGLVCEELKLLTKRGLARAAHAMSRTLIEAAELLQVDLPTIKLYRDRKLEQIVLEGGPDDTFIVTARIQGSSKRSEGKKPSFEDLTLKVNATDILLTVASAFELVDESPERYIALALAEEVFHVYQIKHYPASVQKSDSAGNGTPEEYAKDRGEIAAKLFAEKYANSRYPL